MVNLVVRHDNNVSSPLLKSPSASEIANRVHVCTIKPSVGASPSGVDRIVPSPIRVPYLRNRHPGQRPVSPLTASDSMFGMTRDGPVPGRTPSSDSTEERQEPSISTLPSNNGADMVCDYDHSITPLYEMLESSQWKHAQIRCSTNPEEVHTWIVRRDPNDKIRWKLLPLHAAVIFQAPMQVIEAMLTEHPLAATKRDDQGMLPIHLAFRHKSDEIILEKLIIQYPDGVSVKDRRDRLPLDHGKESQFSYRMMQLYSETFAKCQFSAGGNRGGDEEAKAASMHEARLSTIKEAYEARINAMIKEQEQAIHELKIKAEKDLRAKQSLHSAEMDELRDLLSRELSSGQKVVQLEAEIIRIKDSLAQANQESKVLRRVVHDQRSHQQLLMDEVHHILNDQKSLHEFCVQQQDQLDQAHQLKQQLLRTLLQKEDGKDVKVSDDLCQMSSKILARTENILKEASPAHAATIEHVIRDDADEGIVSEAASKNAADETAAANWGPMGDHRDDISAITENSHY